MLASPEEKAPLVQPSRMWSEVVRFNSKSADRAVQCLSNFAPLPVTVDGIDYPTGEHAFHGSKFRFCATNANNTERLGALREKANMFANPSTLNTGLDAKRAGGKSKLHGFKLEPSELSGWDKEAERVQTMICLYKLKHYEQVRQVLEANKGKLLLHQDNRAKSDTIWGGRVKPITKDFVEKHKMTITMDDTLVKINLD
jgi:predicted NAD-dependent protein-ADP-ribosyltransferase YbiA (DUF1768 family)